MPEAGDAEAKLTLRMPEVLRKRLVVLAEGRKTEPECLDCPVFGELC